VAAPERTPEQFFEGFPVGLSIYRTIEHAIGDLGQAAVRVTTSQIAFRRRKGFAYVWRPGRYVDSDVPAVLSLALPYDLGSARFKEVARPAPAVWMHHLELRTAKDVDAQVRQWLREAFEHAG